MLENWNDLKHTADIGLFIKLKKDISEINDENCYTVEDKVYNLVIDRITLIHVYSTCSN